MLDKILSDLRSSVYKHLGSLPIFLGLNITLFNKGENEFTDHFLSTYRLAFVRKGKIKFVFSNQEKILEAGNIILLKPEVSCKCASKSIKSEVIWIGFIFALKEIDEGSISLTNRLPENVQQVGFEKIVERYLNEAVNLDEVTFMPNRYQSDMRSIINLLYKETISETREYRFTINLYFAQLIIFLLRAIEENLLWNKRLHTGNVYELIDVSRRYILDNYNKELTVTDVANNVFLSPGYFTRVFRERTGISPLSYIFQIRIAKACKLLEKNNYKVHSIATEVGFASPQRFNSAFRKQMGMTPKEYRLICRKRIQSENSEFLEIADNIFEYSHLLGQDETGDKNQNKNSEFTYQVNNDIDDGDNNYEVESDS